MVDLLWIVVGIVLGLVTEHVLLPAGTFFVRSCRQTQRLRNFPERRNVFLMAALASDRRILDASRELYESGPDALVDEFEDVIEWLTEDQFTASDVEEIYLVTRPLLRPRSIRGVLYATLYRKFTPSRPPCQPRAVCFVSIVCASGPLANGSPTEEALGRATRLWERLRAEVGEDAHGAPCDFYFLFPTPGDDGLDDAHALYWAFLSRIVQAQQVATSVVIPEFDDDGAMTTHDAVLLVAGLQTPRGTLRALDVAEFLYGVMCFWAFGYQGEASGFSLPRLEKRTKELTRLRDDLVASGGATGELALMPIEPSAFRVAEAVR